MAIRRVVRVLAVAGALFVVMLPVGAAVASARSSNCQSTGYGGEPAAAMLHVDDTNVVPGQIVGVSGSCCVDGTTAANSVSVTFTLGGVQVGQLPISADGSFSGSITIPATTAPGTYQLDATGCQGEQGVTITVGSGATSGTTTPATLLSQTPLARTGSDLGSLVALAVSAILLGSSALYFSYRRRRPA